MIDVVESDRLIARSRERFLAGEPVETGGVRGLIVSSWRRCRVLGLPSERLKPPYNDDLDLDSALMRAAEPVLDRLDAMVAGTWASVTLADAKGVLLRRRAGDLGLTRAIEELNCGVGFTVAEWAAGTTGVGMALMETHFFVNHRFQPDDRILKDIGKIQHIPTHIVQGRYDNVCPPFTAWDLKKAMPGATMELVMSGHAARDPEMRKALLRAHDRIRDAGSPVLPTPPVTPAPQI